MKRWLFLAPLVCALSACSVASVREAPNTIAVNQCQSNSECPGGVCDGTGQCRSESTSLQKLLFEVTAPANGSPIAGTQFLIPSEASAGDGAPLVVPPISQVSGRVTAKDRTCTLQFVNANGEKLVSSNDASASVPARVSLIPTSTTLGLYSPWAVAQSSLVQSIYWGFSANVPPGKYDIYVEPGRQPDASCPVAPQLLRGQKIGAGVLSLDIDLAPPSTFEFHVAWPLEDGGLDGWMVDMLDPVSGRVISNRIPLTLVGKSKSDYRAVLSYSSVGGAGAQKQDQLLRLSPPEGLPENVALPSVLMARSGLGLFSADRGTLTAFKLLPTSVLVHGQVTLNDSPTPVAATTTLVADSITGIPDGVLASFSRTVTVGADGLFDVYLPPGKYRVSTVPQSPLGSSDPKELAADSPKALGADTREWIVPAEPYEQAGKVIDLGRALPITGQVVDSLGLGVATAQVQAVPSAGSVRSDVLQQTLDGSLSQPRAMFVPRASTGGVESSGDFSLKSDPGTFDITVRPDANTGFPWLVTPNVAVTTALFGVNLGQITMPLPFRYAGTVTSATDGTVVPGALVRAYIYVKDGQYTTDDLNADSLLQVGEARAGTTGTFELLVPAELNQRVE